MRKTIVLALAMLAGASAHAQAQLPVHLSLNAGTAIPVRNEADNYKTGFHLGAGLKVVLIPLQVDGAIDRMSAKASGAKDLTISSFGLSIPVDVTPPLMPLNVYLLAGAGMYHHKAGTSTAEVSATDTGLNGGAGVRVGIPGLKVFAEGRGVIVFSAGNKLTYGTLGVGVRF